MLPDVRLIIAAPFASIMALGCGFGMFAAVHVSQEPLRRMPSAPLQLVALDNTTPARSIVAAAPFDNRVQSGEIAGGGSVSALAYSAPEPTEPPASNIVPAAADSEHEASEPAAAATPEVTQTAAVHPAEVAAAEPATKVPEANSDGVATDSGQLAPLAPIVATLQPAAAEPVKIAPASEHAAPLVAAIEPETVAPEPAKPSPIPPAKATNESSAKATDKETKEAKEKKESRDTKERDSRKTRIAAGTHHPRAAHLAKGDAAFELPDFRAPGNWPMEAAENLSPRHRRATAVSSAATATDAGVGGPFVPFR